MKKVQWLTGFEKSSESQKSWREIIRGDRGAARRDKVVPARLWTYLEDVEFQNGHESRLCFDLVTTC